MIEKALIDAEKHKNKEFLMNAVKYLEAHTDDGNQKEGRCL